ncbi:MAG: heme lyase NrfEFG subunit NrfE [Gammaproteobacteria bacterium]|nr:heme lyase NrfEFG subunit NrfE [Gammaproteobacteria bacterium]|tara:strand:+ start:170 stop:2089 length:1920 start_codon:yes stop_codon:yes gene_type:complete
MIPEIGNLLLISALILSFIAGFLPFCEYLVGKYFFRRFIYSISTLNFLLISLSLVCLIYSFLVDDFSVAYVAQNSNTNLPVYYKFAATWGAHEGSLLLWVFSISLWLFLFLIGRKKENDPFIGVSCSVLNQIIFTFIAFTLFTSNPFERILPVAPLQGGDLNPLLQDFAFTIHPPLLYLGYSGLAIPFATAISAMLNKNIDSLWSSSTRPWVLLSSGFLTLGICIGSWWAYYELGWGGWWFWDPVENAAFVPWLISVALFHSLITSERRGLYKNWSLFLSILAFGTSLIGTFLVRSGILTSVHAFALDPERGIFILAIFSYFICGALIIYFFKNNKRKEKGTYYLFSKEFGFLLNNMLLVILAISIFFGTIFPLLYEAVNNGKQISVGAPYFEILILPFAVGLSILQGIGLYLGWHSTKKFNFLVRILLESITVFVVILLILYLLFGEGNLGTLLSVFLFSWVISGTILDRLYFSKSLQEITSFLYQRAGTIFAHLGTAFLILGVGVVSTYSLEREVILSPGQNYTLGKSTFTFEGLENKRESNYSTQEATISVLDRQQLYQLKAEKRFYPFSDQVMTEAAIKPLLTQDFYITLGEDFGDNRYSFRLQIKPFVRWIWFGALLVAIGTFLSAYRQRRRNE